MERTYSLHVTLNLFAGPRSWHRLGSHTRNGRFSSLVGGRAGKSAARREIHVILGNYSPHKRNDDWLAAKFEERAQFRFTPTSASWLNQIEIVFSHLQRKALK